jgi:GxxExxY protein
MVGFIPRAMRVDRLLGERGIGQDSAAERPEFERRWGDARAADNKLRGQPPLRLAWIPLPAYRSMCHLTGQVEKASLPRKSAKDAKREESIMEDIVKLCDVVRETGFAIHRYQKHGHLEKVYENALAHRLRKLGPDVKQQYPLKVYDEDGTLIGDYNADLFVDNRLIIELKAAKALADEHVAQILG